MQNNPKKEGNPIDLKEDLKFFEEQGSSRAVTSGSLSMMFALVGSSCIWLFMILATSWDGLQYFGLTSAINATVGIFAIGFSRYFIAEIKDSLLINEELGRIKAAAYCKVILIIGWSVGTALIIISFFTSNKLLRICYFASGCTTILGYTQVILSMGIEIKNRYDILASLSFFGGIYLLIFAYLFIVFRWNPIWFAFHPFFNITTFILFLYFFRKHSPYSFKEILKSPIKTDKLKEKCSPDVRELIEVKQIRGFIEGSTFSMMTNLESYGIFGNLLVYFTAVYLAVYNPEFQGLGVSILTILMIYGATKTIVLYYSGPLNIEVAEACTKECQDIIQDSVNHSTRISSIFGLALATGIIALSKELLLLLHPDLFYDGGKFNQELFLLTYVLFIMIILGQYSYGYATLFGNALIGSGNAKYAAIGFGYTLIIIIIGSPICILLFGILGVGIIMIISIIFLLPYMLIQLKRKLGIRYSFKMGRLLPNLVIMFCIFYFFPVQGTLGFTLKIIIGGIVYLLLNPFFGVSIPEDIQMINDLFKTIKLKPLGKLIVKSMSFSYNISPFNKDKISS
ncbi:MAG: hypothetical protein ACTSR8_16195 [Promethearchaeota archaeon]